MFFLTMKLKYVTYLLLQKRYTDSVIKICMFFKLFLQCTNIVANNKWNDRGKYDISWYNSSSKTFEIATAEQFAGIAFLVNNGYTSFSGKTIKLSENIDLSSNIWVPIGNATYQFSGILDGNNKTIKGLSVELNSAEAEHDYYGLFGYIKNATIKDFSLTGKINFEIDNWFLKQYIGSVAAYAYGSNLSNITSEVDIRYDRTHAYNFPYEIYIGGLIGISKKNIIESCLFHKGTIEASIYKGTILDNETYTSGSCFYVAGLCAEDAESTIKYCGAILTHIYMFIPGSKNSRMEHYLGGLIARANFTEIYSSYSIIYNAEQYYYTADISTLNIGGIVDFHSGARYKGCVHNCYSIIYDVNFGTGNSKSAINVGNICCAYDTYNQQNYSNNYSNNDVSIEHWSMPFYPQYNGITTYNCKEMRTQNFVDELNLYYILNGKNAIWELGDNHPIVNLNFTTGIKTNYCSADDILTIDYYSIEGRHIKNPSKGIFIKRTVYKNGKISTEKIIYN